MSEAESGLARPGVSLVIPTHDRAGTVIRAVASCTAHASLRVEIIVVDDGSGDATRSTLSRAFGRGSAGDGVGDFDCVPADGHALLYRHQHHAGAGAARNRGLRIARGDYVKFLDSDDELIPGALEKELEFAHRTGVDVVVTGWEERVSEGKGQGVGQKRIRSAPHMEDGIDDMLEGRSPWTAAALYRREFVAGLEWDESCEKAQDWDWAWTVCLAGGTFATLDIPSAVYNQHQGPGVSGCGDPFLRSTRARQRILGKVEEALREQDELTADRRTRLAQYYYKDSKVVCEQDRGDWRRLWAHCRELDPRFRPFERDPVAWILNGLLGPGAGVALFVQLRRMVRALGIRRHES